MNHLSQSTQPWLANQNTFILIEIEVFISNNSVMWFACTNNNVVKVFKLHGGQIQVTSPSHKSFKFFLSWPCNTNKMQKMQAYKFANYLENTSVSNSKDAQKASDLMSFSWLFEHSDTTWFHVLGFNLHWSIRN